MTTPMTTPMTAIRPPGTAAALRRTAPAATSAGIRKPARSSAMTACAIPARGDRGGGQRTETTRQGAPAGRPLWFMLPFLLFVYFTAYRL